MKSCDHCGSLNHDNHKQCWCCSSSDLSACLGADAQQTDAVPPRLGDGPAWLAEFETWLQKRYVGYVFTYNESGLGIHHRLCADVREIIEKLQELKTQGQAKATQPESHDG